MVLRKRISVLTVIILSIVLMAGVIVYNHYRKKALIIENWMFTDEQIEAYGPFWITVPAAENKGLFSDVNGIEIKSDPESIYLIFPSKTNLTNIVYYVRDGYESNYEARRVGNFSDGEAEIAGKQIKAILTDIPIIYITTDDKNTSFDELLHTKDYTTICTGQMTGECIGKPIECTLKPRGNWTWVASRKKPYSLLVDKEFNLLGLGELKSWNLIADAFDPSLLKNYTINYICNELNVEYEPRMKHILLFINNNFEGIYLLTTKIKVGKDLVDIDKNDWFMCFGGTRPQQSISYKSGSWERDSETTYQHVDLIYPENESKEGLKEKQVFIQKYVDALEDEKTDEYKDYLDEDSMIRNYWINEFSMNVDAAYRSIYSYYDYSDGKLHYAPLWDFDYALGTHGKQLGYDGNEVRIGYSTEGWQIRQLSFYHDLFEHEGFTDSVKEAYWNKGIRDALFNGINGYVEERDYIGEIGEIDYNLLEEEDRSYAPFLEEPTYYDYTDKVLEVYKERLEWIDNEMSKEK